MQVHSSASAEARTHERILFPSCAFEFHKSLWQLKWKAVWGNWEKLKIYWESSPFDPGPTSADMFAAAENTRSPLSFRFGRLSQRGKGGKKPTFRKRKVPGLFSWLLTIKHHVSLLSGAQASSVVCLSQLLPLALMLNCSCVIVSLASPFPFSWVTDMTFRYTGLQLLSPGNWIISFLCQQSRGLVVGSWE